MTKSDDSSRPQNPYDESAESPARASHRRSSASEDPRPPAAAPPPDPEAMLSLPRGALVGLRKSGGLRFSSRELIVYRNGRVVQRRQGTGMAIYQSEPQQLGSADLANLVHILERTRFPRFSGRVRQSPDAMVYEIAARVGGRVRMAEAAQSRIPESLAPLIGWLNGLLAVDE